MAQGVWCTNYSRERGFGGVGEGANKDFQRWRNRKGLISQAGYLTCDSQYVHFLPLFCQRRHLPVRSAGYEPRDLGIFNRKYTDGA